MPDIIVEDGYARVKDEADPFFDVVVPEAQYEKDPEIYQLIAGSGSMSNNEKQWWVEILPSMTDGQVFRLRSILVNEKSAIEEIERKYAETRAEQAKKIEALKLHDLSSDAR